MGDVPGEVERRQRVGGGQREGEDHGQPEPAQGVPGGDEHQREGQVVEGVDDGEGARREHGQAAEGDQVEVVAAQGIVVEQLPGGRTDQRVGEVPAPLGDGLGQSLVEEGVALVDQRHPQRPVPVPEGDEGDGEGASADEGHGARTLTGRHGREESQCGGPGSKPVMRRGSGLGMTFTIRFVTISVGEIPPLEHREELLT
jgi:hypothetical protein